MKKYILIVSCFVIFAMTISTLMAISSPMQTASANNDTTSHCSGPEVTTPTEESLDSPVMDQYHANGLPDSL